MLVLALVMSVSAVDTVRYEMSFPNINHNEAQVRVIFPAGRDTVTVRMSRSSPGRYAIHEFAKNVYSVKAADPSGAALPVVRTEPYSWSVVANGRPVEFTYTVFADRGDGTYAQFDISHAHMNMPAVFAWADGYEANPVSVRFVPPAGSDWRAATQLVPTRDPMVFAAPDLQYFFDSPTELSRHVLRTWTVAGAGGRVDTIKIAMHHLGTDTELDDYVAKAKRIVAEQIAVFGDVPRFDHGSYTFLADYLPWAAGDGMEHRNSTIISSTASLAQNMTGLLGTLSHEFFHAWNMERIRSAASEPFDFSTADPTGDLWFGEGFTQYYGQLTLHRAGVVDEAAYLRTIGGIVNSVVNSPARRYGSPVEMSIRAPFVDAATAIDPTNFHNIFLSYYTWGAGVAVALDLSLRGSYPNKDLDGFMQVVWQRFGGGDRYKVARTYTIDDIEAALADYTGDRAFARSFFDRHVRGSDAPDYAALLTKAGVEVRKANPGAAVSGLRVGNDGVVASGTSVGTPAYDAGIDRGDQIRSIDGRRVTDQTVIDEIERAHKPGDRVNVVMVKRGVESTVVMTLAEDSRLLAAPTANPSEAQRAFRAAWLGSKAR
jgi:predicted metalloprotease with PDZ domain